MLATVMRRLPVVLALLVLAGCGGDSDKETDSTQTETGPVATDVCLGERGFSLRPTTSGVSAVSPTGAAFTIVFFDTEAEATEAASGAEGSTAIDSAVVTAEGKQPTRQELATIEDCIRGA